MKKMKIRRFFLGLEVRQSHSDLFKSPGEKVEIFCSHDKTDYRVMLWYQQPPGDTALKLTGYLYYQNATFESRFSVTGDGEKEASLHIQNLKYPEDSGEYFGAASMHSDKDSGFLVQKPSTI
uniref:Immunoglobulin V-set domain-containing protein n=1 Tax=Kryptolebias marmoratus TaxID=37003 RepID=A0A3Q3GF06_KRYMA